MSKNIKNRVFALVLGIIICLNVVILSPRKTEAVVGEAIAGVAVGAAGIGVGPAVVIGVLTVIAGAFIVSVFDGPVPGGEDTNTIAADFANWVAENKPTEFNIFKEKIAFNVASAGLDVMDFLADVDTIKMFSSLFTEFLVERGSLTSAGASFSYASSSDLTSVNYNNLISSVKSFADSYYNAELNAGTIDWFMQRCHTSSGTPRYFYIYDMAWPDGNNHNKLCLISSAVQDPTFFYRSGFRCFEGVSATYIDLDGALRDNYWCGYGVTDDEAVLLTSFYFDPALSDDYEAGSIIDLGLSESLQKQIDNIGDSIEDIAAVIDQFIADQVLEDADSRVTHYPDGTTSVDDGVVTTFPGAVDEDGNVDTPDNVDTKPWDDVFSRPVPDVYVPEGSASDLPAGTTTSWYSKLLDWLNSFWKAFLALLKYVFVPDLSAFNGLTDTVKLKFSIVYQLYDLWDTLLNSDFGSTKYEFKFTLPASFLHSNSSQECLLIDFSLFDQYRDFFHAVIILLCYLAFAKRLADRLPTVLGYPGGGGGTVVIKE